MRLAADQQTLDSVFLVRLENSEGIMLHFRLFSRRDLADAYVADEPVAPGQQYRIIERQAVSHAVQRLKTHENQISEVSQ